MTLAGLQPESNLARLGCRCWVELKIKLVMTERDQRQTEDQDNRICRCDVSWIVVLSATPFWRFKSVDSASGSIVERLSRANL